MTSTQHARATSDRAAVKRAYGGPTDAQIDAVANFVKITGSPRTACEAAGVPWETARYWLKQARAGREPYLRFKIEIDKARALREVGLHYTVQQHAMTTKDKTGDWRAAMAEINRIAWMKRGQQKRADQLRPPGSGEETVILMYPVRVDETEHGVKLQPLEPAPAQLPAGDAFDTEGEEVADDE